MCSSRLAGEAVKSPTIASSLLGPESCARSGSHASLRAASCAATTSAAEGVEFCIAVVAMSGQDFLNFTYADPCVELGPSIACDEKAHAPAAQ